MKNWKRIIVVFIVLTALVTVAAACGDKGSNTKTSSIDEIKERGKIRIGVFGDKPPFGYVDSDGKNQGYDVYLAKRLAKDLLGDENAIEFVIVEAASRAEFLQTGKVDVMLANFTVTEERKQVVDFALPYMKVALGVVSPESAKITNVDQLKGKTLIVNKGTTAELFFKKNYPDIKLLAFDENTETFNALKDGRGDALAHDNTLVFAWSIENKGFETGIESLGSIDTIAPAVQKGNKELLDWINNDIKELGKESFFHEDYNQTLLPIYGDTVAPDSVVVEGGVVE